MIVLVILGLLASVTGVAIKKLIDANRFETEVAQVFTQLQEAQVLSACYQTDLALDFFQRKGKFFYRFSTAEPLSKEKINQAPVELGLTQSLKFKDSKVKTLHFDIYSGGRIEPRGILKFIQDPNNEKALWIDLQRGQLIAFAHRCPKKLDAQVPSMPK